MSCRIPPSRSRRWRPVIALPALFFALFASRELVAHDVSPHVIRLRPGAIDFVFVTDPTGCNADIRAVTTDPGVVTIYAADMSKGDGSLRPGDGTSANGFGV